MIDFLQDGPWRRPGGSKSPPRGPLDAPKRLPEGFCKFLQGSLQGFAGVFAGVFAGSLQGIAGGSRGEGEWFMRSSKKELLRQLTPLDGPILTPSSCTSSASPPVLIQFQKVTDVPSLSRCMLLHFPHQTNSPEHRLCNCNAALARHSWTPNVDTCVTGRTSEQYGPIGGRMCPITYDGLQLTWNGNASDALWAHRRQIVRSSNMDT